MPSGFPFSELSGQSNRQKHSVALSLLIGLFAIHEMRVAHGDLKTSNELVNDFGEVRIIDFGNASLDGNATKASVRFVYSTIFVLISLVASVGAFLGLEYTNKDGLVSVRFKHEKHVVSIAMKNGFDEYSFDANSDICVKPGYYWVRFKTATGESQDVARYVSGRGRNKKTALKNKTVFGSITDSQVVNLRGNRAAKVGSPSELLWSDGDPLLTGENNYRFVSSSLENTMFRLPTRKELLDAGKSTSKHLCFEHISHTQKGLTFPVPRSIPVSRTIDLQQITK